MAPTTAPVRKTPDITDIVGEKVHPPAPTSGGEEEAESRKQKAEEEKGEEEVTLNSQLSTLNSFPDQWGAMFEQIFASVPTIYIPLKESLPKIENNIITVDVKNEIQKEHFEAKAREVLEFLRTHYDEKIEDIVVETNEQLETKKIIYDVKDKLQNFKEQNEEFEEFLQVLDLKIKY